MIKAKSKVVLNLPRIKSLERAQVIALEQTAEALHTEVVQEQVIPRDTGNLQGESFFVDYEESSRGKVTLVHNTPYARRLYYHPEYHFKTNENPNAKGKWFEDWTEGGKKEEQPRRLYKQLYRRIAGL